MAQKAWPTKNLSVTGLQLDSKNPRLGRETTARAPRDIIQYLFKHDKALEVVQSIAARGYFTNEPLLAVKEGKHYVVVEGNRRLAALKALQEPGLVDGALGRNVERLARKVSNLEDLTKVPVVIAPNRKATDRQIAGRHVGRAVLSWEAENRASFILDKLSEGYTNETLREELGFTDADIQSARQTRAIADMARAIDLPAEIRAKLESPRAQIFSTIERIIDSSVGRQFLKVEKDLDHGLRGTTTKEEFERGFARLVTDIALGKQSSRTLNTNAEINAYFESWTAGELPTKKRGSFVPADVVGGKTVASTPQEKAPIKREKSRTIDQYIVPRNFKVKYGSDRLVEMRKELSKLRREDYPNSGPVLLRVFLELSILYYLDSIGELSKLKASIKASMNGNKLPRNRPNMNDLSKAIVKIAKIKLSDADAKKVEKALRHDPSAPFTINDLHAFVHSDDLPSPRDTQQFWSRTEPLFRLMLENAPETSK